MTPLSAEEAFPHVADAYRWLAASACSLDSLNKMSCEDRQKIDTQLPNIDVALDAAILIYGRALIEFYSGGKQNTDIGAKHHFDIDLGKDKDLEYLRKKILPGMNVHLAHITEYRHPSYPGRATKPRPNWNTEIPGIVDRLVNLLKRAVEQEPPPKCQAAFKELLTATKARRTDSSHDWKPITPS